jgi:ribonuclease inhibitor
MLVLCDFARLDTAEAVYDHLERELSFPPYFGRNLDALHDCLTDVGAPTRLILTGASSPCGEHFVRVFKDAARRNKYQSVEIHEG